jgi:hypothetical protein
MNKQFCHTKVSEIFNLERREGDRMSGFCTAALNFKVLLPHSWINGIVFRISSLGP